MIDKFVRPKGETPTWGARGVITTAIYLTFAGIVILWNGDAFAEKRSVDLSAKAALSPFGLPQQTWTDIDGLVFLIGFDLQGQPGAVNTEYAKRFGQLRTYPRLRAASQRWRNETFPLLQNIAVELSRDDIKIMLDKLSASFGQRKTDPEGFNHSLMALNEKFSSLGEMTGRATQQAQELDTATRAAIAEYRTHNFPESPWLELGPRLDHVQGALGLMNGQWGALISDLQDLRRVMANNRLDDVDIDVGRLTWEDIQKTASGFVTDIPHQQRILSGDIYYDNCSFTEHSYYHLVNLATEPRADGLTFTDEGLRMIDRGPRRDDPRQLWQFSRMGQGWWKISNKNKGTSFALDGANLAPAGSFSGQFWRCLPAQTVAGERWVRLINAYNGEFRSLGMAPNSTAVLMEPTTNARQQSWRFSNNGP